MKPQGGGKLNTYRRCMGEPQKMTGRDYLRPQTSRDDRSEKLRHIRRVHEEGRSKDELDFQRQQEDQETDPLDINCTWQVNILIFVRVSFRNLDSAQNGLSHGSEVNLVNELMYCGKARPRFAD